MYFISSTPVVYCTTLGLIDRAYDTIHIKTMGLSLILKTKVYPVTALTLDWLLVVYLLVGLLMWAQVRVVEMGGCLVGALVELCWLQSRVWLKLSEILSGCQASIIVVCNMLC